MQEHKVNILQNAIKVVTQSAQDEQKISHEKFYSKKYSDCLKILELELIRENNILLRMKSIGH